jgi:flavin-dependent dehydrogenase
VSAGVVICADGLSRSSVRQLPQFATRAPANARIGIGATLAIDRDWPETSILMAISQRGYVGIAPATSRGQPRLNIAAAVDPALLSGAAIQESIASLLDEARLSVPAELASASWHGTPPLTSAPAQLAADRLFLVGDAAGYVEPFTGDGMAAAIDGALALAPLVVQAAEQWNGALIGRWTCLHRRLVRQRQAHCRRLAWVLRRPWAVRASLGMCRAYPQLAERIVQRVA